MISVLISALLTGFQTPTQEPKAGPTGGQLQVVQTPAPKPAPKPKNTLSEILKGQVPATLTFVQIPDNLYPIEIDRKDSSVTDSVAKAIDELILANQPDSVTLRYASIFWTNGEVLSTQAGDFLAGYRLDPIELTVDRDVRYTTMRLTLYRVDGLDRIGSRADLNREDYGRTLKKIRSLILKAQSVKK